MIKRKSPQEIEIMKQGGTIAADVLSKVLSEVKEGVTTLYLDKIADETIVKNGALCSFKTVPGYKFATCININHGLVHGLPGEYMVKHGDLVSVDLGVLFKGFHTDLSYTIEVGSNNEAKFLDAGKKALKGGIAECKVGNQIGDISSAMQHAIESAGYTVSRELVGHGIGRSLHEDPYVPGYGEKHTGARLRDGYVLAIEIIYQKGSPRIRVQPDDWTIETADGSLGGLFEQTVAVTSDGPIVLTSFSLD